MKKYTITIFILFFTFVCQASDSTFLVKKINVIGNKKTKIFIILRELSFKVGDSIKNWNFDANLSRQQVINLFLFNEVFISKNQGGEVTIEVKERWYVWPFPVLEYADRNINQWWLSRDPKRLIYGIELKWHNVRGRNESILLDFKTGYTQLFNVTYKIPFINEKKTWGMQIKAGISANREVWYKTEADKVQFFRDKDRFLINRNYGELMFTHRKKILNYHQFYGGFRNTVVKDTVLTDSVNVQFFYKNQNIQREIYFGYQFVRDKRNFKGYPLKGHYIKAIVEGPIFFDKPSISLKATMSKYLKINTKFYAAFSGTVRYFNFSNIPYSKTMALGYDRDVIRGYELNVIDGNHFALGKSELKYLLLNKKYNFFKQMKNYEQLPVAIYLTGFADAGYVKNENRNTLLNNKMPNTVQYGGGMGLNMVLYYDYCLRIEYSVNRYEKQRFYFSFITAI